MKPPATSPVQRRPAAGQHRQATDERAIAWEGIIGQRYALGQGHPPRPARRRGRGIVGAMTIVIAVFIGLGAMGEWSLWLAGLILVVGVVIALAGERWMRRSRRLFTLTPSQPARPPPARLPRTWQARRPER